MRGVSAGLRLAAAPPHPTPSPCAREEGAPCPRRRCMALPRGASSVKFHCQGAIHRRHQGATPMHDIVIRGGTIVDGTGKAPVSGDVAIAGGRIAAVGGKLGPGKREIDAAGLMVTPGWVDVHTHYDGQA